MGSMQALRVDALSKTCIPHGTGVQKIIYVELVVQQKQIGILALVNFNVNSSNTFCTVIVFTHALLRACLLPVPVAKRERNFNSLSIHSEYSQRA